MRPSEKQESVFQYSIDESNFKIPEFMQNELDKLDENLANDQIEQFNITILGKMRNSCFFVIARFIKFGMKTDYLQQECQLIPIIVRDLSL